MNKPNVLLLDIETAPIVSYTWGRYEQNVVGVIRDWYILCVGYKWIGRKVECKALTDYPLYRKDPYNDKSLCEDLHSLLETADIVIAHNGDMFDLKKINARMIFHGLKPPAPYKTVDTLKIARSNFAFSSNKLNDLAIFFGFGTKKETGGFKLWEGCMSGDLEAWRKMVSYNKQDIVLLEKVYLKLRAWPHSQPNFGMFTPNRVCSICGSNHLISRGFARTKTMKYRRLQCLDCGGWMRENLNLKDSKPLIGI